MPVWGEIAGCGEIAVWGDFASNRDSNCVFVALKQALEPRFSTPQKTPPIAPPTKGNTPFGPPNP